MKEKKNKKRLMFRRNLHPDLQSKTDSQLLGLVTDPMTAGKEDILAKCQKAFTGTLGIRPGGPLGHAKTPEEEGMAMFTITMVSLALNRVKIFKTFTLVLPVFLPVAHRSFGIYDYFHCLYKIVVPDS